MVWRSPGSVAFFSLMLWWLAAQAQGQPSDAYSSIDLEFRYACVSPELLNWVSRFSPSFVFLDYLATGQDRNIVSSNDS